MNSTSQSIFSLDFQQKDDQPYKNVVKVEQTDQFESFSQHENEEIKQDAKSNQGNSDNCSQLQDDVKIKYINNEMNKVKIKFKDLVEFFKEAAQKKANQKHNLTKRFFEEYLFKKSRDPIYVFSLLRLILPNIDRERGNYGIKEKTLADLIADALSLSKQQKERLTHFKNPNYQPYGSAVGDFAEVFYASVQGFCIDKNTITVGEVNSVLDQLALSGDRTNQANIMRELIRKCTAEELKWIVRIILKDLKIGLSHERILNIYHPDALEYYNATSSLREVCKEFQDRNHSLKNVLRIFHPIKPMLAARKKLEEIPFIIENKAFLIETKFDGERIQCHITPEEIKFFSRNSNDYTHIYGKKMSEIIRKNMISTHSAILDGEIIVVEKESGLPVQFGLNKQIALENDENNSEMQLCYKVFDILYIKGSLGEECNLMNIDLAKRKKLLQKVVREVKNNFELVNGLESSNYETIVNEFNNAIIQNQEGIIIKQLDSLYYPNSRATQWLKMKGDYFEGMTDTLDLIIIGGYFGKKSYRTGQNGDWTDDLTHFLIGLSLKIDQQNPLNSIIIPFCKIGTGYTGKELQSLRNELRPHWKMWNMLQLPQYFYQKWKPSLEDKPDAYIDNPKNSKIIEVKAAEIIRSHTWPSDYTLRFPRVVKIRYNKDWNECMTLDELKELTQNQKHKRQNSDSEKSDNMEDNDQQQRGSKTKNKKNQLIGKKLKLGEQKNQVLPQFQDTDISNIQQLNSQLFQGFQFYIINLDTKNNNIISKQFLEQEICKNSGNKVQNDCYFVTHFIADHIDFRVEVIINKYNCSILKPKWIIDCISQNQILDWSPRYLLYTNQYLANRNNQLYDIYGDSYTELIDKNLLKEILSEIKYNKNEILTNHDFIEDKLLLRKDLSIQSSKNTKCYCFFEKHKLQNELEIRFVQVLIKHNSGKIVTKLIGNIDYIVKFNFNKEEQKVIDNYIQYNKKTQLITLERLKQALLSI